MTSACDADAGCDSVPERESGGALSQQVRNRQAATSYLQAAAMTDDAVERERLRRHAARLISPDLRDRYQRLDG